MWGESVRVGVTFLSVVVELVYFRCRCRSALLPPHSPARSVAHTTKHAHVRCVSYMSTETRDREISTNFGDLIFFIYFRCAELKLVFT